MLAVDGSTFSVAADGAELSCPFEPEFPVFIWLEVQCADAKYQDLKVSKL